MITFERTFDLGLVRSILCHPRIWGHISDDFSPPVDEYRPVESDAVWYVLARDRLAVCQANLLALWMFVPQNGICWEVHTAVMPCAWGEPGLEAAKLLPAWIWEHTPCRRIVTNVPTRNRLALSFAVKAGMKIWGYNEASYQKDGLLYDQVCLGISAPNVARAGPYEPASQSKDESEGICLPEPNGHA